MINYSYSTEAGAGNWARDCAVRSAVPGQMQEDNLVQGQPVHSEGI